MRWTIPTLALALALAGTTAHAQDAASTAAARALFTEGVALAREHRYDEAADRFRRALELRPSVQIAWNLASALSEEGQVVEASEVIARLLRERGVPRDLRTRAEAMRAELAPRIARLTIELEGDAADVGVRIGSRELAAAAIGVALPIDPGGHEIVATRDGEEIARAHVEMAEGESDRVALRIPARPAAPPPVAIATPAPAREPDPAIVAAPTTDASSDDGAWIGVGVGLGVAAVGAIVVTSVMLTLPPEPMPVSGTAMPGVLTW